MIQIKAKGIQRRNIHIHSPRLLSVSLRHNFDPHCKFHGKYSARLNQTDDAMTDHRFQTWPALQNESQECYPSRSHTWLSLTWCREGEPKTPVSVVFKSARTMSLAWLATVQADVHGHIENQQAEGQTYAVCYTWHINSLMCIGSPSAFLAKAPQSLGTIRSWLAISRSHHAMSSLQLQRAREFISTVNAQQYDSLENLLSEDFTHQFYPVSLGMPVRNTQGSLNHLKGLRLVIEEFNVSLSFRLLQGGWSIGML